MEITRAGKLYYDYVKQVASLEKQLQRNLVEVEKDRKDKIYLGIGNWRGTVMLPKFLPFFSNLCPNVEIQVLEGNSDFLINAIHRDHVDFCIMSTPASTLGFVCELIVVEKILLVGNNDHPLVKAANRASVPAGVYRNMDISALLQETFLLTRSGQNFAQVVRNFFHEQGTVPENIREINNLTTAYNMVTQGCGFAFLPECGLQQTFQTDNVSFFTMGDPPLEFPISAVYKTSFNLSRPSRLFIDMLKGQYNV